MENPRVEFDPAAESDVNLGAGNTLRYRKLTVLLGFQLDFGK